jgi:hypothetical protein
MKKPNNLGNSRLQGAARSATKRAAWRAIPPQMYMLMMLPTLGCLGGIFYLGGYALSGGRPQGGTKGLLIGVAVLLVIGSIFLLIRSIKKRRERKRAAAFEDNLKTEAAQSSGPVSDPADAARVDDMRQKFQRGIDVFRQYGKNVYDFPWYVMVGEPGAGKTEAIRNSSINFPEGLQDKQQGVGGTYSMDWWFTDRAILLDTAGALLTESDSATRFEEFLKMLKTHRPDCPINGMIIAVSVESLLLDDLDASDQKGLNLSKQLTIIQKILGIRFSVYLMITKSDLITGFKEYCDAPANTGYDRQCFGWSNPYELDVPIKPSEVCAELESMATQLRFRRWTILQDPLPKERDGRRIDEVDALFAFPDAVSQVVKRLSRYLDIVFSDSEWSDMPPFFRGVYFTSSKREGAALDQQLAQALQMAPDRLPEGGIWGREKSLYLRDLFMGKIFREQGLVTRLRDVGSLLRKRLVFYYAVTACLLTLLLGLGLWLYAGIVKQIERESPKLTFAHDQYHNGSYAPLIIPKVNGGWRYNDTKDFRRLMDRTAPIERLKGFGFFRPLEIFYERDLNDERTQSRQIVIAGSVLKPLLDATRSRLQAATREQKVDQAEMEAVESLLRLKLAVAGESAAIQDPLDDLVAPLLRYVLPTASQMPANDLEKLREFTKELYWEGEEWMVEDSVADGESSTFHKGLNRFLGRRGDDEKQTEAIARTRDRFKQLEDQLLYADPLPRDAEAQVQALGETAQKLTQLSGPNLKDDATYSSVWRRMNTLCELRAEEGEFSVIRERLLEFAGGDFEVDVPAPKDGETEGDAPEKARDPYLSKTAFTKDQFLFAYRYQKYQEMLAMEPVRSSDLIGKMAKHLSNLRAREKLAYDGEIGDAFLRLCENLAVIGHNKSKIALAKSWRGEVKGVASQSGRFPLVKGGGGSLSPEQFPALAADWTAIAADLEVLKDLGDGVALPSDIQDALDTAEKVCGIVKLLWNAEAEQITRVELSFSGTPDSREVEQFQPPPAAEPGKPVLPPPPPITKTENKGIDECTVYLDSGDMILKGKIASRPTKETSIADGIYIDYEGWPAFGAGKEKSRFERFRGDWGILRALEQTRSRAGASQSVKVPTRFSDGSLMMNVRFSQGRYSKSNWIAEQELKRTFGN